MKKLLLGELLNVIGKYDLAPEDDFEIRSIQERVDGFKAGHVLFHRLKDEPLDINQMEQYLPCAIIIEKPGPESLTSNNQCTVVTVVDIDKAYWNFVDYYRSLFTIPVYGVSGTCGKSTTKEMLRHLFSPKYSVQATRSSSNSNRLNLEYLLGIDATTGVAVFEFGVMFADDIINYSRYFKPTVGIITNIELDHLRFINTFDDYIHAKGEMMRGLGYQGTLILNADDPNLQRIDWSPFRGTILYFGQSEQAHFKASAIQYGIKGMNFILHFENEVLNAFVPGYGEHNVYNALAAIAGAYVQGIGVEEALDRLKSFKHMASHLQLLKGLQGSTLIDDTFSSNPKSNEVALEVLAHLGKGKTKIAVMGRMSSMVGPLEIEKRVYKTIGKTVVAQNIDYLLTLGARACIIGQSAIDEGMSEERIFFCDDSDEVLHVLNSLVDSNCFVLFKTCWGEDFSHILSAMIISQ